MKKILLITAISLLMLLVSGCCSCNLPFSANFGATPQPSTQPTTVPTSTSPVTGTSFAGTWDTDYGNMVLAVSGNKVTGTYDYQEGTINGTVSGNKLTGTWTQAPTRAPPDDAGNLVFTLSADGSRFEGLWSYGYSNDSTRDYDGFWYGTRIS